MNPLWILGALLLMKKKNNPAPPPPGTNPGTTVGDNPLDRL